MEKEKTRFFGEFTQNAEGKWESKYGDCYTTKELDASEAGCLGMIFLAGLACLAFVLKGCEPYQEKENKQKTPAPKVIQESEQEANQNAQSALFLSKMAFAKQNA